MVNGNEKKAEKSAEFGVKAVSEFGHGHVEFGLQVEPEAGRGRGLCSGMPALRRLRGHSRRGVGHGRWAGRSMSPCPLP